MGKKKKVKILYIIIDFKEKLKDKNFLIETSIQVFLFGLVFFFITWILTTLILTPFFSPKIDIDSSCKYLNPFGQTDLILENKGRVGEEGFTVIINKIILTNFTKNWVTTTYGESAELLFKYNVSAYKFSEEWAKNYCFIESNYPIIEANEPKIPISLLWNENPNIKIYCKYFPPRSKTNIRLNAIKPNNELDYIYWGKGTKVTSEIKKCKPPICESRFGDLYLDIYFKLIKKYQMRYCSNKNGDFTKFFGSRNPKY